MQNDSAKVVSYTNADATVAVTRHGGRGRIGFESNCEVATVAASGVHLLAVSWHDLLSLVRRMFESGRS
jgi:hypothetical protein